MYYYYPFYFYFSQQSNWSSFLTSKKDPTNNEWAEKIEVKVGAEETITIIAINKDAKVFNIIGQAVIYLSSLTKGQQVKKVDLEHKS